MHDADNVPDKSQSSLLDHKAQEPKQAPKPETKAVIQAPLAENKNTDNSQVMSPVKSMAGMIAQYAKTLTNDKRAQEFAARVSLMARNNPKIAQAIKESPESFISAMMACVTLDLMPNTPEQDAHIIPYRNNREGRMEVQFQTGYPGMLKLARRSGEIQVIDVELVFQGDEFDVQYGTERKIIHKPNFEVDRTDYSKVTHAYVTTKLTNGENQFVVLTKKEIDKIKNSAKASSTDAPWATWPEAMARKTAIKRAAKLLPKSTKDNRFAMAVEMDSLAEAGKLHIDKTTGEIIEGEAVGPSQETLDAIDNAQSFEELQGILNGLPTSDRKKVAPLIAERAKDL